MSDDPNMAYKSAGDDMSKDVVFADNKGAQAPNRGICAPCIWFKEKPLSRWPFALMLLFGILGIASIAVRLTGSLTGDLLAGISGVVLALYAANHFRILLGLKEQVDRLGRNNREFKATNAELKVECGKLTAAAEQLNGVADGLKQTQRAYEENVTKFKALDEKLNSLSGDSIAGIQKLQEMSKYVSDSIEKELVQHERDLLSNVQEAMEFKDDQEGMSETEYKAYLNALPTTYQQRFQSLGSWQEISGDDGNLDLDEFSALCDRFAEEVATAKQKK